MTLPRLSTRLARDAARRTVLRGLVAISAALAPSFFDMHAARATIDVANATSLPRLDASGSPVAKRAAAQRPEGISLQDCLDDQKIRFTLLLDDFEANGAVQAWAAPSGVDCSSASARSGTTPMCWQLSPGVPLAASVDFDARVRDVIHGLPPFSAASPAAGSEMCGAVDFAVVSVQFAYFQPGQPTVPAWTRSVAIEVDTVGPRQPARPEVSPGPGTGSRASDAAVIGISWIPRDSGEGTRIFCAPLGAAAGGADASTAGDVSPCTHPEFVGASGEPVLPTSAFAAAFECLPVGAPPTSRADIARDPHGPLVSGASYIVARAALDAFGNPSPLSPPVCATAARAPESGGDDGGCSMSAGASGMTPFGLLALAAIAATRRRRA